MNPSFAEFVQNRKSSCRENQVVRNIYAMFRAHHRLRDYVASLHVSVERNGIVLRGNLPSRILKDQLIPAIRQAGVMWQICDRVRVSYKDCQVCENQ